MRIALVALLLAGCVFEPRDPAGRVACGPAGECPAGLTCDPAAAPGGLCCAREGCPAPSPVSEAGVPDRPTDPGTPEVTPTPPDTGEVGPRLAPGNECDLVDPDSCGRGARCHMNCVAQTPGFSRAVCRPAMGNRRAGEPCSRSDDCAPGHDCAAYQCGTVRLGVCVSYCRSDGDCGKDRICRTTSCSGGDGSFGYCPTACNPVGATSDCPAGMVCLLDRLDQVRCGCPQIAPVADGGPCERSDQCQTGHSCVRRNGVSVCRPVCRLGATGDCAAGRRCAPQTDRKIFGACVPSDDPDSPCDLTAASCGNEETCVAQCSATGEVISCEPSDLAVEGSACTGSNACRPGLGCTVRRCDGQDFGACRRQCRSNADCTAPHTRCVGFVCGQGTAAYGRCSAGCDPRGDGTRGCQPGTFCYLDGVDATDCHCKRPAPSADGEACAAMAPSCGVGLWCVPEEGQRRCRPICRLAEPNTCAPGRTCTPVNDNRAFGACLP